MKQWATKRGNAIGVASLLGLIVMAFLWRQHEITILASGPLNGSFQLYNPLWRISQGQAPGLDFQYFHGLGTLYAHYPVFAALGGDLSACLVSKRVVSVVGYVPVFLITARAWRIPWHLAASACLFCVLLEAAITGGSLFLPGNSLLGTRTILPVIAVPLCLLFSRKLAVLRSPVAFHTLLAAWLGITCFVSTEQGIASIFATLATITFFPFNRSDKIVQRILWPIFLLIASAAVLIFCLVALTGSEWKTTLRYLFNDVPNNQFWYFGGPPNDIPDYLGAWTRLPIIGPIAITLALLILEISKVLRNPSSDEQRWISISLLVVLISGLVSQAAHLGALSNYYEILIRNSGLLTMVWIVRLSQSFRIAGATWIETCNRRFAPSLFWPTALAPVVIGAFLLSNIAFYDRERMRSPIRHGGVTLSKAYAGELETWNQFAFKGAKVASTYTSLIEDVIGRRFGGPDYLIHALGSQRPLYQENLEKFDPDYFLTLNPTLTPYEEWLQLRHWDLYQNVIKNYQPVAHSHFHVFWRKSEMADHKALPDVNMERQGAAWKSAPNKGAPAVFTIQIQYQITNSLKSVPVIGRLTRYFAKREVANDSNQMIEQFIPAPLPPSQTTWEFPILLKTGEQAWVTPETRMDCMSSSIAWKSVVIRETSSNPDVIKALIHPTSSGEN